MMRLALVLAGTFLLVSAHLLYGLTIEMSESVDSLMRLAMVLHAVAAFYAANSVNWSADNNNGKNFLTMLRSSSVRLVKAAVRVFKR